MIAGAYNIKLIIIKVLIRTNRKNMKTYSTKYRVYYEDTDAGGVVYYGNYMRFAERARSDFLRTSGKSHVDLMDEYGVFFVVKKAEIEYKNPGRIDDMLEVKTSITKIGASSVTMRQEFYNQNQLMLADANMVIVCVKNLEDGGVKSVRMPEEIRKHFSE